MNNKKKSSGGIHVGTSLVLVIFVLLCLLTFATLSLITVQSDINLTSSAATRVRSYYNLYGQSEFLLSNIDAFLNETYNSSDNGDAYYDVISDKLEDTINTVAQNESINIENVKYSEDTNLLTYTVVFDNKGILVTMKLKYLPDKYDIIAYKSVNTSKDEVTFTDDMKLNLFY